MKSFMESGAPVPRRGMLIFVIAGALLMAASITAGAIMSPEGKDIPVVLADGEVITPPWYITIDGEKIALVDSQQTAQEVVGRRDRRVPQRQWNCFGYRGEGRNTNGEDGDQKWR